MMYQYAWYRLLDAPSCSITQAKMLYKMVLKLTKPKPQNRKPKFIYMYKLTSACLKLEIS